MAKKRTDIHTELERKLKDARQRLHDLKERIQDAGDDASDEVHEAVSKAEGMLERGHARLAEVAERTDDEFDVWWAKSEKHWHGLRRDMDRHWDDLSHRVKGLFS